MSQYPLISLRKHPFLLALRRWRRLAGREKGKRKNEGSFLQFPPVLFSCLRFLNSGDPTISELEQASYPLIDIAICYKDITASEEGEKW